MFEVYHAKFDTDAEAARFMRAFVVPAGAELHHSKSFCHEKSVLVLTCPKGTKMDKTVWELVFSFGPKTEETKTVPTTTEEKTDEAE